MDDKILKASFSFFGVYTSHSVVFVIFGMGFFRDLFRFIWLRISMLWNNLCLITLRLINRIQCVNSFLDVRIGHIHYLHRSELYIILRLT